MNEEVEVWKPVPGSNDVEASNLGRIRQFGRVLEQHGKTYLYVVGCKNWGKLTFYVHRLVALAWLTLPDDADVVRYDVNHIDEDKRNNRAANLNYLTRSGNMKWGTCPERISEKMKGVPKSAEHCANIGKLHKGRIWFTNGLVEYRLKPDEPIPEGFVRGRLSQKCV